MDVDDVKRNFLLVQERGWFLPGPTHIKRLPRGKKYRQAAVLFLVNQDLQVLLTKRSMTVSNFKGQSCLPGGSVEHRDKSILETALREAQEEVNLDPEDVEVLCVCPPSFAIRPSFTLVTPVLAITRVDVTQLNLQPCPAEVDTIFWVPLEFFVSACPVQAHRIDYSTVHGFNFSDHKSNVYSIHGLTSYLCIILSTIALQRYHHNVPEHSGFLIKELVEDEDTDSVVISLGKVEVNYSKRHGTSKL